MRHRTEFIWLTVFAALALLAACGPTPAPTAVPTPVPPTAVPTAVVVPTSAVAGGFQPLANTECQALQQAVAAKLGVQANLAEAPFQDYIGGGTGTACLITASGTGVNFPSFGAVATDMQVLLAGQGWTVDLMYAADGPTGTAYGMRKDNRLGLISVMWTPASDANCPQDKPISECQLAPGQQLYTITLRLAQK
jgi:predicted small lipoprotein YifL